MLHSPLRRFAVIAAILVIVIAASLAAFAAVVARDPKPWVERYASSALARALSIGAIEIAWPSAEVIQASPFGPAR
jgi:uncharacterized protein involved in outer membrane biogenesis